MSATPEIFGLRTSNVTHICIYVLCIWMQIFWAISEAFIIWQQYLSNFATFISRTPEIFVIETLNFTHVRLCTMHMYINNLDNMSNIYYLVAIFCSIFTTFESITHEINCERNYICFAYNFYIFFYLGSSGFSTSD